MPTLAATLRHEIRRLASREVRRALRPLARMQKQFKSLRVESRNSRRGVTSLERGLLRLRDRLSAQSLRARIRKPSSGPRVPPRTIRALRARLGLPRVRFAKLLGVSPGSIFGWETGRTIPRGGSRARLLELLKKSARTKGGAGKGSRRR